MGRAGTNFRNTLPVLPPVESGPRYPTRVLSLEEEGLALAILESEDLAVPADIDLTLKHTNTFHVSIHSEILQENSQLIRLPQASACHAPASKNTGDE